MTALKVSDVGGGQEIVIRPDHRLARGLLTGGLLTGLLVGELSLVGQLLADVQRNSVLLDLFLVLWSSVSAWVALLMLWISFGRQVVSIRGSDLTIKYKIGPTTISRPKTFAIAHIQGIRIEERTYKFRGKPTVKRAITFDYLGQKQDLLTHLSAQRADSLLAGPLHRFVPPAP